ncbi:ATP-binding protein [Aquidulcibacter sp.]|jgi:signal transduction histidine kinase/CheY-like chemotaxis protein|uniref:ATP-binding protein n=1 Tax=Aquidulcibacter sp. TaxID=2052990 RepID=UPI0028A84BE3|nr:ATP-binding protein [Aquidulcibacter sp.]
MIDPRASARDLQSTELVAIYAPMARAYALILGVYYILLTAGHLLILKGDLAIVMACLAATSGAIILTLRFTLLRTVKDLKVLGLSVFLVNLFAVTNVVTHASYASDEIQFVYLLMIAFSSGILGPTLRVVGVSLALVTIGGAFLTITGSEALIVTKFFTGLTAVVGSLAASIFLHRIVRSQVDFRVQSQDLLEIVERERIRAQNMADEADFANRAKTDFLANMSHELRTPLNGVVGIANTLVATKLDVQQKEMVDLIDASGRTLARLLSDILDFSKIEAGKVEIERVAFDLRAELDASALLLQTYAADKKLQFCVTYGEHARGWFFGDATRIKQIVANLVSNAVKFTDHGEVHVFIDWSETSEILEIKVRDTGIGFDKETGRRLFQRFIQADTSITRRFGGTGLGLAICRGLIEAMGGGMNWESEPGVGSTFIVRIPLEREMAPSLTASPDALQDPAASDTDAPLRILAAEDHPTNQKVLRLILEPLGIDLTMCDDGIAALKAYQTSRFDVILMDMQMPVMDGLTATQAIREHEKAHHLPETPIVMVTANAMRQHRDQAIEAGANSHLAKPFTPASLMTAIEAALIEAQVRDGMDGDTSKAVETNSPTHLSTDEKMLGMF